MCILLAAGKEQVCWRWRPSEPPTADNRHFLEVLARQAAIAIERLVLADEARTEELRSSLLSSVSHDLRTPLAVITGAATTLRDDGSALEEAQRSELVDSIVDEATRMERLIGNLLDMTRLESGIEVKRDWVPLEELIGAAAPQLGGRVLRVGIADDVPLVAVDAVLFQQVFVNLFENIAKYTSADASVTVRARREGADTVVEVRDNGPGFVSDPDKAFDKFVRGQHSGAPGVGLGLAIVRSIITAHGGGVTASNDHGALLRFTIPIVSEPPEVPHE